jgi:hypothetical protein
MSFIKDKLPLELVVLLRSDGGMEILSLLLVVNSFIVLLFLIFLQLLQNTRRLVLAYLYLCFLNLLFSNPSFCLNINEFLILIEIS